MFIVGVTDIRRNSSRVDVFENSEIMVLELIVNVRKRWSL